MAGSEDRGEGGEFAGGDDGTAQASKGDRGMLSGAAEIR